PQPDCTLRNYTSTQQLLYTRITSSSFFSFTVPPPSDIYTLSLHDALPILGYPWLFVSNSDVLVEFNFHVREVRVLQKVAHDSGWGPASSRDPHDNFWLVPVLLDLSC